MKSQGDRNCSESALRAQAPFLHAARETVGPPIPRVHENLTFRLEGT